MYKRKILAILLGLATIILMGCESSLSPSAKEEGLSLNSTVPSENKEALSTKTNYSVFPAYSQSGVYLPREVLYYFDFETNQTIVFCAAPGCRHDDDSCIAYLGNAQKFCEYQGNWYTVLDTEDGRLQLLQTNPSSGVKKNIYTWKKKDECITLCNRCVFAFGHAYLSICEQPLEPNTEESEEHLYQIDLDTGVCHEILVTSYPATHHFLGASQTQLALEYTSLGENFLGEEEYKSIYGTGETYSDYMRDYLKENLITELRIYNFETNDYLVLADSKTDGYTPSGDPTVCYGDNIIYLLNDDLYIYNLSTATNKKILSAKNIMTYWLLDGKAFYITGTVGDCGIFFSDLLTGKIHKIKNQGSSEHMIFSISTETSDKFVGLYSEQSGSSTGQSWISKKDFYEDNYTNARVIG